MKLRRGGGGVWERLVTSWPVTAVWAVVSVAVASASLVCLAQPAWFVRQETRQGRPLDVIMFGAFSFCYRVEYLDEYRCHAYGGLLDFRRPPSGAWQAACLLYGGGCILLTCCALAAILVAALPTPPWRRQAASVIGLTQAIAVAVLLSALLVFPLGLGSPFVRHYCGEDASIFWPGGCQMGWAYALALVAAVVAIYCPLLASFTAYKVYKAYDKDYWTAYNRLL